MTALFKKNKKEGQKPEKQAAPDLSHDAASPAMPKEAPAKGSLVKGLYVSEKASRAKGINQYVFEVTAKANRPEIRKEIEKKYSVHVVKMNILNRVPKKVTVGRFEGNRPGLRKAIVTLKTGESIPD